VQRRRGDAIQPRVAAAHVVERRHVHFGCARRVERLHQVDLHGERASAKLEDVLIDILLFAHVRADLGHAQRTLPQRREPRLVEPTDGHLLQPEHAEWAHGGRRG